MFNFLWFASISFVAALSGAVVPGPVFIVTISESLKRGRMSGPLIVLGHLILEALIIIAIFLGLDVILRSPQARMAISYIGGATLILMGSYLIRTVKRFRVNLSLDEAETPLVAHGLIATGMLSSGSNPHFFLWWLTIGMPIMGDCIVTAGAIGFIAFFLGHSAADMGWFSFVSYSVAKGRRYLNQNVVKYIIFGSAIFLVIFGLITINNQIFEMFF